jgi:serine/threonine protein kinase
MAKRTRVVTKLAAGGNACALRVHDDIDGKDYVFRLTHVEPVDDPTKDFQYVLSRRLKPFVPYSWLPEETSYDELPDDIIAELKTMEQCNSHRKNWKRNPDDTIWLYKMEYATLGTLEKLEANTSVPAKLKNPRRIAFLLIGALYAAQLKWKFEHGDITERNIVLTYDMRGRELVPQFIDFDFSSWMETSPVSTRPLGTLKTKALEFYRRHLKMDEIRCRVAGAADMWAVGMIILLWTLGKLGVQDPWRLPDTIGIERPPLGAAVELKPNVNEAFVYYSICALHSLLFHEGKASFMNTVKPECLIVVSTWADHKLAAAKEEIYNRASAKYSAAIQKLTPEEKYFFRRMLNTDPHKRLYHGHVFHYFSLPYFTTQLTPELDVYNLIRDYITPLTQATTKTSSRRFGTDEGPLEDV